MFQEIWKLLHYFVTFSIISIIENLENNFTTTFGLFFKWLRETTSNPEWRLFLINRGIFFKAHLHPLIYAIKYKKWKRAYMIPRIQLDWKTWKSLIVNWFNFPLSSLVFRVCLLTCTARRFPRLDKNQGELMSLNQI